MIKRTAIYSIGLGILGSIALSSPASATTSLCGVVDQSPGDLDDTVGIVAAICDFGTGSFTGSLEGHHSAARSVIVIHGEFVGFGTLEAETSYTSGPNSPAIETASVSGTYYAPPASPGAIGLFTARATASTFTANSAEASVATKQGSFSASDFHVGRTKGDGTLLATIDFDAGDGSFNLPHSATFAIAVPEMSTWAMLIFGFGAIGAANRYRQRGMVHLC